MSLKNAYGIYQVLTNLLKASNRPLTCVELFDDSEVRRFASDANRVSDYLGHLYRRKILSRVPSAGVGSARWAYSLKPEVNAAIPTPRVMQPRLRIATEDTRKAYKAAEALRAPVVAPSKARPRVSVTEGADEVTIELDHIIIVVKTK